MTAAHPNHILKDKVLHNTSGNNNIVLPEKVFSPRDSYFREIYKNELVKSLYYIFGAQVIAVLVCMLVEDFTADESELTSFSVLKHGFRRIHLAALAWCVLFVVTLLVFWIFQFWSEIRMRIIMTNAKRFLKLWDNFWIASLVCYYCFVLYLVAFIIEYNGFSFILSFIMLVETLRLFMKTHSFIRSSAPEIIAYKPHSDMPFPRKKFANFFYFLFCPTLLYKDEYPRTTSIRWKFVVNCMVELIVSSAVLAYLYKSLLLQPLEQYGGVTYAWRDLLVIFFRFTMAAPLFTLLLFGFVLDSWQNLFAEFTMFADRLFYKDWWNSTDYLRFYKTWNVVVHDWLYEYVYKEVYTYIIPGNKLVARIAVLLLSAIFHELIIYLSLGVFYPLLFVMFFFVGSALTFVKVSNHLIWHLLFIYGQCFGNILLMVMYTIEYKTRYVN